jgi:hypothetical protein
VPRKPSLKQFRNAGVRLEEPVISFLDQLATEQERHRSWLINRIVRDFAAQRGTPIPTMTTEAEPKRVRAAR